MMWLISKFLQAICEIAALILFIGGGALGWTLAEQQGMNAVGGMVIGGAAGLVVDVLVFGVISVMLDIRRLLEEIAKK